MASTYTQLNTNEEDLQKKLQEEAAQSAAAQTNAADLQEAQKAATQIAEGAGGYTPSAQLQQAQQYVQQVQQQKPAAYESAYTPQLQAQFEAIMNRQPFQYDAGTDPLFQQYSDMYVQKGRRAMQDTMGQAAALTGGYGNSYAQGAGQAAYGNYLQELNALAPEFQANAYTRWQGEGADMMDRYNALAAREESDYGRYQDALNAYWAEVDRAQQAESDLYNREYGQHMDKLSYDQQQAEWAQQQKEWEQSVSDTNREYAYNTALMILQGGSMPSTALLNAAGLSAEDAALLMAMYTPKSSGSGSGGSSKGKTTGTESTKENLAKIKDMQTLSDETGILSRPEWEAKRDAVDPFNAAKKEATLYTLPLTQGYNATPEQAIKKASEENTKEYDAYAESAIESAYKTGKISGKKAIELAYRLLKD